jgi:integrase/recombinase XerD
MADTHSTETLSSVLSDFSRYLYARRGLGDITVSNHINCIRRLAPTLGVAPTIEEVEQYIMNMRKSGASYSHVVNTSVSIERYMEFRGTPITLGRPRKPRRLIRGTLSEAEITLMIAAAKNLREKAILSLLAYSGIRNRELCNLRIGDIDVAHQVLQVHATKTEKDRTVAISGSCIALLIDYLRERGGNPDDLLFVTIRHGDPYQPQVLRKLVRKLAARAGIHKRAYPHLLRHSLATNLLNRGANLVAIKEQLGHVFVDTTMIYVHSAPERMQMEYRMFAPSYM